MLGTSSVCTDPTHHPVWIRACSGPAPLSSFRRPPIPRLPDITGELGLHCLSIYRAVQQHRNYRHRPSKPTGGGAGAASEAGLHPSIWRQTKPTQAAFTTCPAWTGSRGRMGTPAGQGDGKAAHHTQHISRAGGPGPRVLG